MPNKYRYHLIFYKEIEAESILEANIKMDAFVKDFNKKADYNKLIIEKGFLDGNPTIVNLKEKEVEDRLEKAADNIN